MEIPDLSKLSEEAKARLGQMAEENGETGEQPPPQHHEALTAFLVIVNHDGQAWAQPDCNFDLSLQRMPTPNEVYGACAQIQKDVMAAETAQRTMKLLDQRAAIAAQQMAMAQKQQEEAAAAEQIRASLGNLRTGGR